MTTRAFYQKNSIPSMNLKRLSTFQLMFLAVPPTLAYLVSNIPFEQPLTSSYLLVQTKLRLKNCWSIIKNDENQHYCPFLLFLFFHGNDYLSWIFNKMKWGISMKWRRTLFFTLMYFMNVFVTNINHYFCLTNFLCNLTDHRQQWIIGGKKPK